MKNSIFTLLLLVGFGSAAFCQDFDKKIVNWYNGPKYGMSTDLAYTKLLVGKRPSPVIVAVIDSGVDIEHEDLVGHIWVNPGEIPGNGIDDDNNGYIDDINGWNFLGNANGENINDVQLEMTRIYAKYDAIYAGRSYGELSDSEKGEYDLYKEVKEVVDKEIKEATEEKEAYEKELDQFKTAHERITEKVGGEYTFKDLKKLSKDPEYEKDAVFIISMMAYGYDYESFMEGYDYWKELLDFNYNLKINPRTIVGDDPDDFTDTNYGNADVEGPDASHGTHVSGIIAAVRGNGLGGDGVSDNALIMSLRAVPNGDERDKDVALAIRYAVDNGAEVINMSFGKPYSPYQSEVIDAFRYAEDKGVLLVHGAGNESADNDVVPNFPCPQYPSMEQKFTNWIEVGASTEYGKYKLKKGYIQNYGLVADFSNYGKEMVDVFAPGYDILSTTPNDEYDVYDGTSMASPMVAGVAALLKSYYPSLTMLEIKEIIFESVQDLRTHEVIQTGEVNKLVTLQDLCVTGGVVNVYNAVLMAEEKVKK